MHGKDDKPKIQEDVYFGEKKPKEWNGRQAILLAQVIFEVLTFVLGAEF